LQLRYERVVGEVVDGRPAVREVRGPMSRDEEVTGDWSTHRAKLVAKLEHHQRAEAVAEESKGPVEERAEPIGEIPHEDRHAGRRRFQEPVLPARELNRAYLDLRGEATLPISIGGGAAACVREAEEPKESVGPPRAEEQPGMSFGRHLPPMMP
jgi:hypothetical protein